MELWEHLVLHALLCVNAFEDVKEKKIAWKMVLAVLAAGLVLRLIQGRSALLEALWGVLPGVMLLLIGKLGKGAVGYGDGILVAAIGIYAGISDTFELLLGAMAAAAAMGAVLLIGKRGTVKTELPFAPFLLWAYVGGMLIGRI